MSSQTPNLHLTLPAGTEHVSRQIINDNNTRIDTAVGNIGTREEGTNAESMVAVANETAVALSTLTLSKGRWILIGCADWQANATGYRQISFSSGLNPNRIHTSCIANCGSSKETYQQVVRPISVTESSETITLYGRQNSGGSLNVFPYLYATRLRDF